MFGLLTTTKSKIKITIIVVLIGALATIGWMHRDLLLEAGKQSQVIIQQLQTLDDMEERVSELEEMREMERGLLDEYLKELREFNNQYTQIRQDIEDIKRDDPEAKEWSENSIPESIIKSLPEDLVNYPNIKDEEGKGDENDE